MIGPDDPVPLCNLSNEKLRLKLVVERLKNTGPSRRRSDAIAAELAKRGPKEPQPKKQGFVYVVKCGNRVKIGFTTNPQARLENLSTAAPDPPVMLMWKPGTEADEENLHLRFSAFRVHREWFSLHGALLKFLRKEGCNV